MSSEHASDDFIPLTRREFLQTSIAVAASIAVPIPTLQESNWFLHVPTGLSWRVDDPVAWALENANTPMLERARDRLVTLTSAEGERILRLVTRRCRLNLIRTSKSKIVVHHWGQQGLADLRPFFKEQRLSRPEIAVELFNRKSEVRSVQNGDDYLYGERIAADFPIAAYEIKWQRRDNDDADDWEAAPESKTGFGWVGVEPNRVPWAVLKRIWRRGRPKDCENCDRPMVLTNLVSRQCGMFNRVQTITYTCGECRRSDDWVIGGKWIVVMLDPTHRPATEDMWGHPVPWRPYC